MLACASPALSPQDVFIGSLASGSEILFARTATVEVDARTNRYDIRLLNGIRCRALAEIRSRSVSVSRSTCSTTASAEA